MHNVNDFKARSAARVSEKAAVDKTIKNTEGNDDAPTALHDVSLAPPRDLAGGPVDEPLAVRQVPPDVD